MYVAYHLKIMAIGGLLEKAIKLQGENVVLWFGCLNIPMQHEADLMLCKAVQQMLHLATSIGKGKRLLVVQPWFLPKKSNALVGMHSNIRLLKLSSRC